jgi:dTDP-4-amino-4,6-dideoxygalactose transaminase
MMRTRVRTLPPAGGPIPYRAVWSSLRESLAAGKQQQVQHDALVAQLTKHIGLPQWVFMNSGRSALSVVLMALHARLPRCNEVIIPAYTSYSVPAAVVRAGLRVRLCDIEPDTLGLDPASLKRIVTDRTLCIVPHHLFGLPCRIREICEVAGACAVPVIEDVAQGLGISCEGRGGGLFGEASIFSISRGKNIPGAGGGLIGMRDENLAGRCRALLQRETQHASISVEIKGAVQALLMAWFIHPSRYWLPASLPFLQLGVSRFDPAFPVSTMTRFQQALLSRLLPNAANVQERRQAKALCLRHALQETKVEVLWPRENERGAYLRVPVLLQTRDAKIRTLAELNRRGLGSTEGYPLPLSKLAALRTFLTDPDRDYPIADAISSRLITLPTHVWVTDRDIKETAEVMARCAS